MKPGQGPYWKLNPPESPDELRRKYWTLTTETVARVKWKVTSSPAS